MVEPVEVVERFMAAFEAAWPTADASTLGAFFSDDAVFHNIPMEPVRGREAIEAFLAGLMGMGGEVGVDIRHVLADGELVMTERVDHFTVGGKTISLPIMGTVEVHDGLITAWRDYFDLTQFTAQMG